MKKRMGFILLLSALFFLPGSFADVRAQEMAVLEPYVVVDFSSVEVPAPISVILQGSASDSQDAAVPPEATLPPEIAAQPDAMYSPEITPSLGVTPSGRVTASPKETESPGRVTAGPRTTPFRRVTASPKETESPGKVTASPGTIASLGAVSSPGVIVMPGVVSGPGVMVTPGAVSSPGVMASPGKVTATPKVTVSPGKVTATPRVTVSPGKVTATPKVTVSPEVSASPSAAAPSAAAALADVPLSPDTVVPVYMAQPGVVEFVITAVQAEAPIEMCLFGDQGCSYPVGGTAVAVFSSQEPICAEYSVAATGIYYLRFRWSAEVPLSAASLQLQSYACRGGDMELTGDFQAVYSKDESSISYHELTVEKKGVVQLYGSAYQRAGEGYQPAGLSVCLCDKKKSVLYNAVLDDQDQYRENLVLKKGTYYIRVEPGVRHQLRYSWKGWKDQSGKNKKKAKLIRRKKALRGMISMTDGVKRSCWFKVRLKKKEKLHIKVTAVCTGTDPKLRIQVVPADKHYVLLHSSVLMGTSQKKITSRAEMDRGVYYIRVMKKKRSFSGAYSIRYIR